MADPDIVRLACEIRLTGASYKETARQLEKQTKQKYNPVTIWKWRLTPVWKEYESKLEKKQIEVGLSRFDMYLAELQGATDDLKDAALENLRGAAIAQQKLTKMLAAVPDNLPMETVQDFAMLIRAQTEVSKGMLLCWEVLEKTGKLSEFMADNSAVEIAFEPYGQNGK